MHIELINTGTELLLGRVLNTHQQWLCRRLGDLGYLVTRQVTVADTATEIAGAVREALARADLVIATGGLGPTSDDLTRETIASLLNRKLQEDPVVLNHIEQLFQSRKRAMPARTRIQAMVPEGALVLPNPHGTAPGLAFHVDPNPFRAQAQTSWLIMLPGPPRELHPMFNDAVVPLLRRELPSATHYSSRTFRMTGIGESQVEEKLIGPMTSLVDAGLELGYCARPGEVDVRLSARGPAADKLLNAGEAIVLAELEKRIYAVGEDSLEAVIIKML